MLSRWSCTNAMLGHSPPKHGTSSLKESPLSRARLCFFLACDFHMRALCPFAVSVLFSNDLPGPKALLAFVDFGTANRMIQFLLTWAEDRATVGTDPSADPGAKTEGAALCRPAFSPLRDWH